MDSCDGPVDCPWGQFSPQPRYGLDLRHWRRYLKSAVTARHWFAPDVLGKRCSQTNAICTKSAGRNPYRDPEAIAAAHSLIQMSHVPGIEASESAPPLPPAKKRRGRPPKNANAAALRPTTAFSNATDSRPKPKLKLNFKKAKLTPPKHVADDTDGDTIAVSHKFKALGVPDTAYSQFNNLEMVDKQVDNSRQARNNAATNRLWGGKGKQPARDVVSGTSAAAANSHNDRDVEILEIVRWYRS